MKKYIFTGVFAFACLLLCGCSELFDDSSCNSDDETLIRSGGIIDRIFHHDDPAPLKMAVTAQDSVYVKMNTVFANQLLVQAVKEAGEGENVCLSPLSIQVALGMLANGLSDGACRELLDVMVGKDVKLDDLNGWYHLLRDAFEATNCVSLANAVWVQTGFPIQSAFIEKSQQYYDAEVGYLDFKNDTGNAIDSICQWAYDHTYGHIREMKLPVNDHTAVVSANALWFASNWSMPFSPDITKTELFKHSDGTTQEVDMMHNTVYPLYADCQTYRLLALPIGDYCDFSMLIALPKDGEDIDEVMKDIDWSAQMHYQLVKLSLPRFRHTSHTSLRPLLEASGIKQLFQNSDALCRISPDLQMGFINQDVSFDLNEDGVEGAAITTWDASVTVIDDDRPTPTYIDFIVDHPFLFAIRDNKAGNLLFLGKMETIETTAPGKGIEQESTR